ncbi:MAG: hypothetical protein U5L45_09365 [Saprospiraceae bacterium]|nr:hypothetical protein [Saprospiraceae bacterium]
MWFVFRRSRKTNHIPSLARAKRARDAKNAFRLCPSLNYIYNYAGERFDFTPEDETTEAMNSFSNWLDSELKTFKKRAL